MPSWPGTLVRMRPSWSYLIQNDSIVTGGLLCLPQEVSSIVWSSKSITTYSDQMVALVSYQQKAVFGQSWLRAGPFLFLFKPLSHHITLACSGIGRGVPILSRVTVMFSWRGYFGPASDISVNLKTKGNKNIVTEIHHQELGFCHFISLYLQVSQKVWLC